jgi:DNA-binding MarR family transcriptional regulator
VTDILREIGMIARALDSISNIEFKELSLTRGQYLYLVRVCENPGIIQEKIAELIKVDRTTAARAIKRLENKALFIVKKMQSTKKLSGFMPQKKGKTFIQSLCAKINTRIKLLCKACQKWKFHNWQST